MENTVQTESTQQTGGQNPWQKIDGISIKINIKIVFIVASIIIVGVLAYTFKGLFVAATVDGKPISRLEILRELEQISGKNILDSMIMAKLIQNEAEAKKIKVSEEEIKAEINKIEERLKAQGSTLAEALTAQKMDTSDLRKQIIVQKEMEKLLADKINVTDEEVAQYIVDNAITITAGQEATVTGQIKEDLKNQKLSTESNLLITGLRSQAKIRYFVNY